MDFDVGEILVIKPSLLLAHSNVITIIEYFQLTFSDSEDLDNIVTYCYLSIWVIYIKN